jgi:hypothetical protein
MPIARLLEVVESALLQFLFALSRVPVTREAYQHFKMDNIDRPACDLPLAPHCMLVALGVGMGPFQAWFEAQLLLLQDVYAVIC